MQKVIVIGCGGAGKSTFSKQLAAKTSLPLIHLDACYWQAGWIEPNKAQWHEHVAQMLMQERWIMDGNFSKTLDARLAACDTVVFIDLSRWHCLWRVLKRRMQYHGRSRPDMAEGCEEQIDWAFIRWIWSYPQKIKPRIMQRLSELASDKRVLHLRSPQAVSDFLHSL